MQVYIQEYKNGLFFCSSVLKESPIIHPAMEKGCFRYTVGLNVKAELILEDNINNSVNEVLKY